MLTGLRYACVSYLALAAALPWSALRTGVHEAAGTPAEQRSAVLLRTAPDALLTLPPPSTKSTHKPDRVDYGSQIPADAAAHHGTAVRLHTLIGATRACSPLPLQSSRAFLCRFLI